MRKVNLQLNKIFTICVVFCFLRKILLNCWQLIYMRLGGAGDGSGLLLILGAISLNAF